MSKVTNKHVGILNVAGVEVRPGASVEVDDQALKNWANGNAAKQWLKQGLIETSLKLDTSPRKATKTTTTTVENGQNGSGAPANEARLALEGKAAGLGIDFTAETSDEDLTNAVAEAEQEAAKGERDALLVEARGLGLNPNANISTEKLKQQIADKKSAQ